MHPQKASCHHQQLEGFTVCFGDGCPQMVASTLHRHLGISLPEKPSCINGQHGAGPTAPQVPARLPSSCEQLGAEEDKERRGHPAVGTWLWVTGDKDLISLVTLSTVTQCRELLLPSLCTEPKARLSMATAFCAEQMSTLGYLSPLPGM